MRDRLTMHRIACGMSSVEDKEERRKRVLFGDPVDVSSDLVPAGNTSFEVGLEGKKRGG